MATCKYCDDEIVWFEDELEERWIPLDPETEKRHDCLAFRGKGRRTHRPDPYRRGYQDGYRDGVMHHADDYVRGRRDGVASAGNGSVDRHLLQEIIRLTHPDLHPAERSGRANRVTAKLNAMLDEQGR